MDFKLLRLRYCVVPWMSEELQMLLQSLVMSCQAKDYESLVSVESELWRHLDCDQQQLFGCLVHTLTSASDNWAAQLLVIVPKIWGVFLFYYELLNYFLFLKIYPPLQSSLILNFQKHQLRWTCFMVLHNLNRTKVINTKTDFFQIKNMVKLCLIVHIYIIHRTTI